jgi:site-specific DNA-adenine methylase
MNLHLMNYYRVLQSSTDQLVIELLRIHKWNGHGSRELFENSLKIMDDKFSSDLEKAVAYFIFNSLTYMGRQNLTATNFAPSAATSRRGLTKARILRLLEVGERIRGVRLTTGSYEAVLALAGKRSFVFLDPPYTDTDMYADKFDLDAFACTCEKHQSDCLIMITLDDCEANRRRFEKPGNVILSRDVYYMARREAVSELMIINYKLPILEYWTNMAGYIIEYGGH